MKVYRGASNIKNLQLKCKTYLRESIWSLKENVHDYGNVRAK